MNTGANGWTNSAINAIAPYLVKEPVICYLDDDNWFTPTHVEACIKTLHEQQADYVYAFRSFYSEVGEYLCPDITDVGRFLPEYAAVADIYTGRF